MKLCRVYKIEHCNDDYDDDRVKGGPEMNSMWTPHV